MGKTEFNGLNQRQRVWFLGLTTERDGTGGGSNVFSRK